MSENVSGGRVLRGWMGFVYQAQSFQGGIGFRGLLQVLIALEQRNLKKLFEDLFEFVFFGQVFKVF